MSLLVKFIKVGLLVVIFTILALAQSDTLPPEKQAIEQQYAQERAAGAQNPAPKDPNAPFPVAPESPFPTGIIDDCAPPFSGAEASIVNCWAGIVNGVKTIVYAGNESGDNDPQQGLVYVIGFSDTSSDINGNRVLTPVKDGGVRIVAAQNFLLTLASISGDHIFTFDVTTRQFVSTITDQTPPIIAGMPGAGCTLWPVNHKLVLVATISASDDNLLAPGTFQVTATSNQPIAPTDPMFPDIVISAKSTGAYTVQLRAERLGTVATDRVYTINATATDIVGNVAKVTATCTVPHDQGH